MATASGVQFGLTRSIPMILGITFGLASLNVAVSGGLGGLIQTFPQFQLALKLFGSLYLLWLAWTIGKSCAPNSKSSEAASPIGFIKGVLHLWLTPKGWTMAVSAAVAYASLSSSPERLALFLKTEQQWRYVNIALGLLLAVSIIPMWR